MNSLSVHSRYRSSGSLDEAHTTSRETRMRDAGKKTVPALKT
jgi:hypothetical protein